MNPQDILDSILKWQHQVDARANAMGNALVKELEAVRERLLGKLALGAERLGGTFASEPLKRQQEALKAQRAEVEGVLAEVYQGMGRHVQAAAGDVMQGTAAFTVKALNGATGLEVVLGSGLTKNLVALWFESTTVDGLLLTEWLGKLEAAAADRIVSVGRRALVESLPMDAMARMLRLEGIEGSVPGLRGLARTFMLSASNYAREQTTGALYGDVLAGWQRAGTLDGRTCLVCGPLDGRTYGADDPRPPLPQHWQCRCLYVPVPKTWAQLGLKGEEAPEGERPAVKHEERWVNHRDGSRSRAFDVAQAEQVPAGTTYSAWMKGQLEKDPAFVKKVLGPARFELFKDGKLGLNRMAAHGRVLSLAELGAS